MNVIPTILANTASAPSAASHRQGAAAVIIAQHSYRLHTLTTRNDALVLVLRGCKQLISATQSLNVPAGQGMTSPTVFHPFTSIKPLPWLTGLGLALALVQSQVHAQGFEVSSPSFTADGRLTQAHVFAGFGCEGGNQSPALVWTTPPEGTQSLAITAYDPDAPTGSGWWHWVVTNLPPQTTQLPANAGRADGQGLPAGAVQGRTDFGNVGYGGACPPVGDAPHRYRFTVHALKVPRLDLPADASAALVGYMLHMNRIASTTVEARYGR